MCSKILMTRMKTKVKIECAFCKKEFLLRHDYVLEKNCCSKKCLSNYKKTIPKKPNSSCAICKKNFYRKPSLNKNKNQYCSIKCFAISLINKKLQSKCPTCGNFFYKKPYQIKKGNCYCSRSCKQAQKKPIEPNVCCHTCNKNFYKKPSQKARFKIHFCSIACLDKHRKNQTTIPCSNCGKPLARCKSKLNKHKNSFCNRKCCGEFRSKNIVGKNHPRTYIENKFCLECNKEFKPKCYNSKYCSIFCRAKNQRKSVLCECSFCKKSYSIQPSKIKWSKIRNCKFSYCSKDCCQSHRIKENHPLWKINRLEIKDQDKTIRSSFEMGTWRKNVFSRDCWQCQLCNNKSSKNNKVVLNAHHIKKYIDFPDLRFNVNNGITLCEKCHKSTYGKEKMYENLFIEMVNCKNNAQQKNK